MLCLLVKNVVKLVDRAIIDDVLVAVDAKRHKSGLGGFDPQIALDIAKLVERQSGLLVGEEKLVDPSGSIAKLQLDGLLLAFGVGEFGAGNGGLEFEVGQFDLQVDSHCFELGFLLGDGREVHLHVQF